MYSLPTPKGIDLAHHLLSNLTSLLAFPDDPSWSKVEEGGLLHFPNLTFKVLKIRTFNNLEDLLNKYCCDLLPNHSYQEALKAYLNMGYYEYEPYITFKVEPFSQTLYPLWVGSTSPLDLIKCFKTHVTEEPVCFGSINKYIAAFFSLRLSDDRINISKVASKWILRERVEGAFRALKQECWLHKVNPTSFKRDDMFFMDIEEYVSYFNQKVKKRIYIPSIYDYIKDHITLQEHGINWVVEQKLLLKYSLKVDTKLEYQWVPEWVKPKHYPMIHRPFMKPVILDKGGKVISGLKRLSVTKYFNQPFAYLVKD